MSPGQISRHSIYATHWSPAKCMSTTLWSCWDETVRRQSLEKAISRWFLLTEWPDYTSCLARGFSIEGVYYWYLYEGSILIIENYWCQWDFRTKVSKFWFWWHLFKFIKGFVKSIYLQIKLKIFIDGEQNHATMVKIALNKEWQNLRLLNSSFKALSI